MTFEPLTLDRRRAMTRQHLLEAAAIVFARNGFHGSTLDEVATTAGFTKGAVYSNFKNKDDLFLELLKDRMERQFAAVSEELSDGSRDAAERLPRVRDLLRGGVADFWDDTWSALYLEFVLYARRNPKARAKLAKMAERERAFVQQMIENDYAALGTRPNYGTRELAEVALAIFGGFGLARMVEPRSITEETVDTTLSLLYESRRR